LKKDLERTLRKSARKTIARTYNLREKGVENLRLGRNGKSAGTLPGQSVGKWFGSAEGKRIMNAENRFPKALRHDITSKASENHRRRG